MISDEQNQELVTERMKKNKMERMLAVKESKTRVRINVELNATATPAFNTKLCRHSKLIFNPRNSWMLSWRRIYNKFSQICNKIRINGAPKCSQNNTYRRCSVFKSSERTFQQKNYLKCLRLIFQPRREL